VVFTLKFSVFYLLLECSFEQNGCATLYEISNGAPGNQDVQFHNLWASQKMLR